MNVPVKIVRRPMVVVVMVVVVLVVLVVVVVVVALARAVVRGPGVVSTRTKKVGSGEEEQERVGYSLYIGTADS
jgi:hypothetical protein